MDEVNIDITRQGSKSVADLGSAAFDYVITVCDNAREQCPVLPGNTQHIHVPFDDPPQLAAEARSEDEALVHYRRVRDEIRELVEGLPERLGR